MSTAMREVFGYIRLSLKEQRQNENPYQTKLLEADVPENRIYTDIISNSSSECAAFRRLLKRLKPGDTLFIVSLDQLGKNCDEIKEHWRLITKEHDCDLAVLDTPVLDTRRGEYVKDLVLEVFNSYSRIKSNYARQRQAEGIAVAKVNDVTFGRPAKPIPEDFPAVADLYSKNLISVRGAAGRLNVSTKTFLKWYRD